MYMITLGNSLVGAFRSTSAAAHALIGVDDVLVFALGDDAERASVCTSAALDASVADNICHNSTSICFNALLFYHGFSKKQMLILRRNGKMFFSWMPYKKKKAAAKISWK